MVNLFFIPYEIITGLKPRSLIDVVLSMNVAPERISHEKYVLELVKHLKDVHKHFNQQHERIREQEQRARLRVYGVGQSLAVGGYCLAQRPLTVGVSARVQCKHHDQVY